MMMTVILAALLSSCAPNVAPDTMRAIVAVESGGSSLAIRDNTTRRSYSPQDLAKGKAIARILLRQGHSLDIGIAQVNSGNFAGYHVTADQMFEPCSNLHVASSILFTAYRQAAQNAATPQAALWGAISSYNTGSLYAGAPYVAAVVRQAKQFRQGLVPTIELLAPAPSQATATPKKLQSHPVVTGKPDQRTTAAHSALIVPLGADLRTEFDRNLTVVNHGPTL